MRQRVCHFGKIRDLVQACDMMLADKVLEHIPTYVTSALAVAPLSKVCTVRHAVHVGRASWHSMCGSVIVMQCHCSCIQIVLVASCIRCSYTHADSAMRVRPVACWQRGHG